ncbi:nuclear transport factor 2 family protein [Vibrio sp. Isolate32]|nr:nuclear transport factor 2 family protein [Vibrio sp. Isolate32]MCG9554508.1 nuclear transport factor 2 family protein [Vibrio sp. Isolate32]
MNTVKKIIIVSMISIVPLGVSHADAQSDSTLAVAKSFLEAAGSGNGAKLIELMSDDFVWYNEGDKRLPWIGPWKGKEEVMGKFMPAFGKGLTVTSWSTDYSFAKANQAVFMGSMSAILKKTGMDTGKFTWAVRVHVEDGKVQSWNWMEDSYAVSKAYTDNSQANKATVETFYTLLSNPGSEEAAKAFSANTTDDWESIGNYSGKNKSKGAFLGQMGYFAKLIPDLNWNIEEMTHSGNHVTVRGRATGTPKGPLFGVDGAGKSFDIMTIDIHTIENGKIVKSHHVEDWSGALNQLKGK